MKKLSISAAYKDLFVILKKHWWSLWQLGAGLIVSVFILAYILGSSVFQYSEYDKDFVLRDFLVQSPGLVVLFKVLCAIIFLFFYFGLIKVATRLVVHHKLSWKNLFNNSVLHFQYMYAWIVPVSVSMGFLMAIFVNLSASSESLTPVSLAFNSLKGPLVIVIMGLSVVFAYLLLRSSLVSYALADRAGNSFDAFSTSWKITHGNLWRMVGWALSGIVLYMLLCLVFCIAAVSLYLLSGLLNIVWIVNVLLLLVFVPVLLFIFFIAVACLYKQLRDNARKNGLLE